MNKDENIGKIYGDYKITRIISRGGMNSVIYEAEKINVDLNNYFQSKKRRVAIKIIEKNEDVGDDGWHRINDEVVTLSRMSKKKNVIEFHDAFIDKSKIVIIMELANGLSLEKKIFKYGHFNLEESIYLFKQILIGVEGLHNNSLSIIHRDLKPTNIVLLKNQTEIRLIDFGIASVIDKTISKDKPQVISNEESFFGTAAYVSPDVINWREYGQGDMHKKITKQFDFHSLGVIFHEMLTGEKPFAYEDESDAKSLKYFHDFDFLPIKWSNPKIPNSIENIIFKLTASKAPHLTYRYGDIKEVIHDLEICEEKLKLQNKDDELLNPINERVFQYTKAFGIKSNKSEKKLNDKLMHWGVSLMSIFAILILIIYTILKLVLNV